MLITNFSSGELSPTLNGRVDLQQYFQGAGKISNFEIIPTGGIKRRTGFKTCLKLPAESRLIPYILDKDNSFIFAFTPGKTYIYKDGKEYIEQPFFENPYQMSDINELQYAQNYDHMIFTCRNHNPFELIYSFATKTFAFGTMQFNFYPDVTVDDDYDFILDYSAKETRPDPDKAGEYCIWEGQLFRSVKEQTYFVWEKADTDPEVDTGLFTTVNNRPACVAFYNNRLFFASTIYGRQKIWASCTPTTSKTRYNVFATWQKYVTVEKVLKDMEAHIFTATLPKYIEITDTITLTNVSRDLTETIKRDPTDFYCINKSQLPAGCKVLEITKDTVTIKLTAALPITVEDKEAVTFTLSLWQDPDSATEEDYEYQVVSNNVVTSDCSFMMELASDQNDGIKWIGTSKFLAVGTENSVWYIPPSTTALNLQAEMNGRYGSDDIQGHCVDTAMIFFANGNKAIRECYYDNTSEAFRTNNIAITAEQMLTESPAVDFDFMTNPYNRIIVTRLDGKLAIMLYDKNNGVMGWYRIEHGKLKINSVAVVRGSEESDIVYVQTKKTVVTEDGTVTNEYYLEVLDPANKVYLDHYTDYWTTEDRAAYDTEDIVYNATTNEFTTLGEVTLSFASETDQVYIGYKYESLICSLPIVNQDYTGKKRITDLIVRFLHSYTPKIRIADLPDEIFSEEIEEPYSGILKVIYPGSYDRDVTFTMTIDTPYECNVLSVNASIV